MDNQQRIGLRDDDDVVEAGDREITARTELVLDRDVIPAGDYEAFRRWVESADTLLRQRIVLTR